MYNLNVLFFFHAFYTCVIIILSTRIMYSNTRLWLKLFLEELEIMQAPA